MAKRRSTESSSLGVKHVRHPAEGPVPARSAKLESSQRFRKLVKWRTGSEGRISHLKHSWGWERTMLDGIDGARTWCGWGVLAHNATKIAALIEERTTSRPATDSNRQLRRQTPGPPRATSTATKELRRLIPSRSLLAPHPSPETSGNRGENDQRARDGSPGEHVAGSRPKDQPCYTDFFRSKDPIN